MYFFERLLYRISISEYKHNFILKGGLLLSAIIGEDKRTTQDMDTMIKGIKLSAKEIEKVINTIINVETDDGIDFKIIKTEDIRLQDIYGGIKVYLDALKESLKVRLTIDITAGDPITPREISFKYKCMFNDSYIKIMTFTKETIIAEKFETLLANTVGNTRAKDFYDLHMLISKHYNNINKENLIVAIKRTMKRRETLYLLYEINNRFEIIKNSERLKNNWNKYQRKYPFAKGFTYDDIVMSIERIVNLLK